MWCCCCSVPWLERTWANCQAYEMSGRNEMSLSFEIFWILRTFASFLIHPIHNFFGHPRDLFPCSKNDVWYFTLLYVKLMLLGVWYFVTIQIKKIFLHGNFVKGGSRFLRYVISESFYYRKFLETWNNFFRQLLQLWTASLVPRFFSTKSL